MSPPILSATPRVAAADELGESVFCSPHSELVHWVDGYAPSVHSLDLITGDHTEQRVGFPGPIGMIAPTTHTSIIACSYKEGVALLNLKTGETRAVVDPEQGRCGIAYNDGKVDPEGRLWLGTYDTGEVEPRGCVWVIENGRAPRLAETGIVVPNGPAFDPDRGLTYLSDSIGRRILAFDRRGSKLSGRRVFASFTPEEGFPDGLTVDAEGALWCAHWAGGRVTRFAPTGERLLVIKVPAPNVTSVAFGGSDLRTLFVTTARCGLSADQLASAPLSGQLFSLAPGVVGVAPTVLPLPFNCAG